MRYTKRKKENRTGRTVISILIMIVLLAAAGGLVYLRWERPPEIEMIYAEAAEPEAISEPTEEPVEVTPAPTPEPTPIPTPTPEPLPDGAPLDLSGQPTVMERKAGVYTILIVGVDQISESTDTMMVCRFDTSNHTIDCVSIPRDTLINVAWDLRKLNAVYSASLHNGGTGIDSLCTHIKCLTGFDVDCYAVVDLLLFQNIINEMGGIWFDVPIEMNYWDIPQELFIDIHPGYQLLDGYQSMCLCRFREDYSNGDLGRIEMQQAFLKAAASQFLTLGNIPHAGKVVRMLAEGVQTNLNAGNIAWFLRQALQCRSKDIHFHTMPCITRNISGYSYAVVEPYDWVNLINEVLNPYKTDISWGMLNIVYYNGNHVESTTEVQDRGYYDENPWGDWGFDLDLDLGAGDFSFDW